MLSVLRIGAKLGLFVLFFVSLYHMAMGVISHTITHPLWLMSMVGSFLGFFGLFPEHANKYYWQHKIHTLTNTLFFWRWYKPRRYRGLNDEQLTKLIASEIRERYKRK